MSNFGFYVIPLILFCIIVIGIFKNIPVFDTFLQGASEGISSTFSIAPSLIGLITAVAMLKASGALDIFAHLIAPISNVIGMPAQVVPLALLRPISGSGSIALLDSILKNHHPDSIIGRIASVIMGSTETTFYTLTVYFGCVGIKNSRHAIASALIADFTAMITAVTLVNFLMNKI
jgi:spore maturation protein B